jgi:predicted nucleic acid-binding protein
LLIYFLEQTDNLGDIAASVMTSIAQGGTLGIISTLALLEVQVKPYKINNLPLADHYYANLIRLPNCRWVELTYAIADQAAQLRAKYNISAPDAIHLATAIESGATAFVTNDMDMPQVEELELLCLS